MDSFIDLRISPPILPLSYGLEGMLSSRLSGEQEMDMPLLIECVQAIYPAMDFTAADIDDLSARLVQRVQRLSAGAPSAPKEPGDPAQTKREFGAVIEEWASSLSPTEVCLLLADHDPLKAHKLFWHTEADYLELALKSRLRLVSVQHSAMLEAVLYGFGGKYSSDSQPVSDPNTNVFDVNTPEGLAALHSLGF